MGRLILFVVLGLLIFGLHRWLTRSKRFDSLFKSTTHPPTFDETTEEIIEDIEEGKHALEDKSVANAAQQDALQKEQKKIDDYTK